MNETRKQNYIELDDPALHRWILHAYLICVYFCRASGLYIYVEVTGTKETWKGIMHGEGGIALYNSLKIKWRWKWPMLELQMLE